MKYIRLISKPAAPPGRAISLLEKQAMTELIQRNITQLIVLLNFAAGLKPEPEN